MGILFDRCFNPRWRAKATDEELKEEYEKHRMAFLQRGGGMPSPEMVAIGQEINRRASEKWKNDPRRSSDPNFRWTDKNRWEK